mmetsp:Transcript_26717/g.83783  ORF Transcript_26717/g.83783 Transcript_26717/m.83783 type:complete len:297 (-) Transcript_26717:277-1167(-)
MRARILACLYREPLPESAASSGHVRQHAGRQAPSKVLGDAHGTALRKELAKVTLRQNADLGPRVRLEQVRDDAPDGMEAGGSIDHKHAIDALGVVPGDRPANLLQAGEDLRIPGVPEGEATHIQHEDPPHRPQPPLAAAAPRQRLWGWAQEQGFLSLPAERLIQEEVRADQTGLPIPRGHAEGLHVPAAHRLDHHRPELPVEPRQPVVQQWSPELLGRERGRIGHDSVHPLLGSPLKHVPGTLEGEGLVAARDPATAMQQVVGEVVQPGLFSQPQPQLGDGLDLCVLHLHCCVGAG